VRDEQHAPALIERLEEALHQRQRVGSELSQLWIGAARLQAFRKRGGPRVPLRRTAPVASHVHHDAEQPGAMARAPREQRELSMHGQPDLLRGVLDVFERHAEVPQHARCIGVILLV
jgi:hypothetical protein